MPFKNKAQMRACFAKKNAGTAGSWNCEEWAKHTPNPKSLPEHSKKAFDINFIQSPEFVKIAKKLFNPDKAPPVPEVELESRQTAPLVQDVISKRVAKREKASKIPMQKQASMGWELGVTIVNWAK
jgi:hypothetical protein